jgi:hypothetical protein
MIGKFFTGCVLVLVSMAIEVTAGADARVTLIEGVAYINRKTGDKWKPLRLNMSLRVDDQVKTDEETLVEITYSHGVVVRLDEQTLCSMKKATDVHIATTVSRGNVWVNMKKLVSTGRTFEVSTPTAVAAIRGTVFQLESHDDSTADVAVYDGQVAVGLSDSGRKRVEEEKKSESFGPQEVPGPHEIPGPFEVTLDQWRDIVAGQRITVRKDGRFAIADFDPEKEVNAFIQKNRALDARIKGAR